MSFELEKVEHNPEIKEEIRLLVEKAESIVKIIDQEEKDDQLGLFGEGTVTKKQFDYIKKFLMDLGTKIMANEDLKNKIKAHTNLNHEIANFEVYFRSFERIRILNKSGKEIGGLLNTFKRKLDEFYKYCVDLSRAHGLLEYEITSSDLGKRKAA